jgi:hypothetical protein
MGSIDDCRRFGVARQEPIAVTRQSVPIIYAAFGIAFLLAMSPAIKVLLFPIVPTIEQLLSVRCFGF